MLHDAYMMQWRMYDALNWASIHLLHGFLLIQQAMICNSLNSLKQRQNGHHFAEDIFKCIFFNEKCLNSEENFTEICS